VKILTKWHWLTIAFIAWEAQVMVTLIAMFR
jgi:D-alanyl-lipoteichoic acid acyltransferase DltB (MBOAT superfamily)